MATGDDRLGDYLRRATTELSTATANGRRVLAILRGSAVNSDGASNRTWPRRSSSPPDPQLKAKIPDVIGLYLDPPANAVLVCVDAKSQFQAPASAADAFRPGGTSHS
jgi:hypothetical protein